MGGTGERFLCRLAAYEPKVFQFDHLLVDMFIRVWGIPSYVPTILKNNYSFPLQTFHSISWHSHGIQDLSSKTPAEISRANFFSLNPRNPTGLSDFCSLHLLCECVQPQAPKNPGTKGSLYSTYWTPQGNWMPAEPWDVSSSNLVPWTFTCILGFRVFNYI